MPFVSSSAQICYTEGEHITTFEARSFLLALYLENMPAIVKASTLGVHRAIIIGCWVGQAKKLLRILWVTLRVLQEDVLGGILS